MQTFLPSTNFEQAAKWLDTRRLGKQRVECLQILKALTDSSYGWQNHPAVKMWRGYECALHSYSVEVCVEWIRQRYKDTCLDKLATLYQSKLADLAGQQNYMPVKWLTEEFASNHRSILLGKAWEAHNQAGREYHKLISNEWPEIDKKQLKTAARRYDNAKKVLYWYKSFNWTEEPAQRNEAGKWPYMWPV